METEGNVTVTTAPAAKKSRITWDEEVIAEHDKDRGTRQIIDEPPTPFHHHPAVSDKSEEYDDHDDKTGDKIYDNKYAGMSGDDNNLRPRGNSFNMAAATPGGGVKGDSMSIFDNWEGLNAKLTFHQMQQGEERDSSHVPTSHSGIDEEADEGAMDVDESHSFVRVPAPDPLASSVLKSKSKWSLRPPGPVEQGQGGGQGPALHEHRNRLAEGDEAGDSEHAAGRGVDEHGEEEDAFKSKRAAHYNEFKLIQAMRAKQLLDDEEEEGDEGDEER